MNRNRRKAGALTERVVCLGPSLVIYSLFFTVPLVLGVYYSTTNWDAVGVYDGVGLKTMSTSLRTQSSCGLWAEPFSLPRLVC